MKNLSRDIYKVDYALVYFSDMESVTRAISNIARAKQSGYYLGSMTANEIKFLNLKKSEPGDDHVVLLNRMLEYIYLTHKLSMFEYCNGYIDNFMRYLSKTMEGQFKFDGQSRHI